MSTAAVRASIIAACAVLGASAARAEPAGSIAFSRKGVVHLRDAGTGTDARTVEIFADRAPLDSLEASSDGARLIAGSGGRYRQLRVDTGTLGNVLCWTAPRLSADGTVVCGSGSGAALVSKGSERWLVRGDGARAGWLPSTAAAVVIIGDAIVAQPRNGAARPLAPHAPTGALSVSPTGERAVGVYADSDDGADDGDDALYTFRLDGTGVRRKLMRNADPLGWSADGGWVLVQQQREACLVRAVGGEYKCWNRYRAAAIAPDGQYALLTKAADNGRFDLYRVELAGASRSRPVKIESDIDGPAAWIMPTAPAPARSTP